VTHMKIRGDTIFGLVLLVAFMVIVGVGMGYSRKAKMLPLVLGIPGVVLTAAIVIRESFMRPKEEVSRERPADQESSTPVPDEQKKILIMFGWVALLVGMIWAFGFVITIPVYMMLFLKARGEKWLLALCFAAASWAFLYWIFVGALKIILYPGILFD
jgi:hypothetical protein